MDQEMINAAYAAFSRGDRDEFIRYLSPDIVIYGSGVLPGIDAEYHGHEGVRRWWQHLRDIWERFEISHRTETSEGNLYLIDVLLHARGAGSGIEVEQRVWHVVEISDGRGRRHWSFWDRDDALRLLQERKTERPG